MRKALHVHTHLKLELNRYLLLRLVPSAVAVPAWAHVASRAGITATAQWGRALSLVLEPGQAVASALSLVTGVGGW
jgi:hypothetical protein